MCSRFCLETNVVFVQDDAFECVRNLKISYGKVYFSVHGLNCLQPAAHSSQAHRAPVWSSCSDSLEDCRQIEPSLPFPVRLKTISALRPLNYEAGLFFYRPTPDVHIPMTASFKFDNFTEKVRTCTEYRVKRMLLRRCTCTCMLVSVDGIRSVFFGRLAIVDSSECGTCKSLQILVGDDLAAD